MKHEDFDHFYARIAPLFWPVLWLYIQRICAWHEENGAPGVLLDFEVTWWGRIEVVRIVKADGPSVAALHAYKDCTADWCLDWLTLWSGQFARLNDVGRGAVGALMCMLANLPRFTPRPAINDSS